MIKMDDKKYYRLLDLSEEIAEILGEECDNYTEVITFGETAITKILSNLNISDEHQVRLLIKLLSRYEYRIGRNEKP